MALEIAFQLLAGGGQIFTPRDSDVMEHMETDHSSLLNPSDTICPSGTVGRIQLCFPELLIYPHTPI